MKVIKIIAILLLTFSLSFSGLILPSSKVVALTSQQKLEEIQKEIDRIKNERAALQAKLDSNNYTIAGYNSQISKLQGEAMLYQKDIDALALEIEQLETTISDLNEQIEEKRKEITEAEENVEDLDLKSNIRIRNGYMNYRMYGNTDPGTSVFIINDINKFFKDSQYQELIQEDTNEMLTQLADLKSLLGTKQAELEESLTQVEKDKEIMDIKKTDLDKKNEDVQSKISAYYSAASSLQAANNQNISNIKQLNDEEMKQSAKAELIKQEIMVSAVSSGQYVLAGTIVGFQGCTGYCFGEHLHFSIYYNGAAVNPCNHVQPVAGCGSNNNPVKAPLRGVVSFNSGFGWRSFDRAFHDGIDITATPLGAPVYAPIDGYVTRGLDCYHYNLGLARNCANYVRISQNNGNRNGYVVGLWHLR